MLEILLGIVVTEGDEKKKSRVFTRRGLESFSMWCYRPLNFHSIGCKLGDLVEVLINEDGALVNVREIAK
jgi:hypothetical protein